ncbi:hypothetical protein SynA1562_00599 [Synechococcus sp. A15-62]|nr:hypothetical protein SynA1562_00599 [Synechococcus sp. A15-62]
MRFLIYEIDSKEVSVEEQIEIWRHAGLPEPTLMVFTGNKSVHVYYVLDKPCGVAEGERARAGLSAQVDGYLAKTYSAEVKTDHSMHRANQPLRLAGSVHPDTGQRAEIVGGCEKRYALEDILQCCPEVEAPEKKSRANGSGFISQEHKKHLQIGDPERDIKIFIDIVENWLDPKSKETRGYNLFLMIGMVAHLLSSRSSDEWLLFPYWNDWCSKAPKYDGESALENKWSSFSNEGSREDHWDLGSLIEEARKFGYEPPSARPIELSPPQKEESATAPLLDDVFPAPLAHDLKLMSCFSPWPEALVINSYLVAVSTAARMGTEVVLCEATNFSVPLNLFHCVVGKTGTQKSPAQKALIKQPLVHYADYVRGLYEDKLASYNEQVKDSDDEYDPPKPATVSLSDTNQEGLEEQLITQEEYGLALLIAKDELAGVFISMDQYKGGGSKAGTGQGKQLLELYDGGSFETKRVGKSRFCSRTKVSITGSIQPDVLVKLQTDDDADGMWARFLFSELPSIPATLPRDVPRQQLEEIKLAREAVGEILRLIGSKNPPLLQLQLSTEAQAIFSDYYDRKSLEASKAALGSHAGLLNKAPGKVGRIAGLLWLISAAIDRPSCPAEIDASMVERAIRIVDHSDAYATQFQRMANQTEEERCSFRLHEIALKKPGRWISRRELGQGLDKHLRENFKAEQQREMLQELANNGYGEVRPGPKGGLEYRAAPDAGRDRGDEGGQG